MMNLILSLSYTPETPGFSVSHVTSAHVEEKLQTNIDFWTSYERHVDVAR